MRLGGVTSGWEETVRVVSYVSVEHMIQLEWSIIVWIIWMRLVPWPTVASWAARFAAQTDGVRDYRSSRYVLEHQFCMYC
jgi:hypothetical protein